MPKKSTHDFEKKYPYIRADTLKPMLIKDILTNKRFLEAELLYNSVCPYVQRGGEVRWKVVLVDHLDTQTNNHTSLYNTFFEYSRKF